MCKRKCIKYTHNGEILSVRVFHLQNYSKGSIKFGIGGEGSTLKVVEII